MDTALDILLAAGLGAAIGIRPFLPALLIGALAAGDVLIDFDGSVFEETWFLVLMLAGLVVADLVRRRAGDAALESGVGGALVVVVAAVVAVLAGKAAATEHGTAEIVCMIVAAAAAVLAFWAVTPVFARVRARLEKGAAALLPLYREGLALVAGALSLVFPFLALLVLAGLAFLMVGGRRREGQKYAGLRILR